MAHPPGGPERMTISLPEAIAGFSPALPLAIALSGGADSTALLHAAALKFPGQVVALHINHGLQAAAADFERHCEYVCAAIQVPLRVLKVNAAAAPGQSPEDAARNARYEGILALCRADIKESAIQSVALAQHADDQVETLLLALCRGAGLAGLAGMPRRWTRGGVTFYRPLLQVSSADIRAWLAERHIHFIEDPTNRDEKFTRNRIRARLLPVLAEVFPQFRDTFARSSAHAGQAQELLEDLAKRDFSAVLAEGGDPCRPLIARLQTLGRASQANVLRHWLKTCHKTVPSTAQLVELIGQIEACTTRGHHINIKIGGGFVKRSGDHLAWYNS